MLHRLPLLLLALGCAAALRAQPVIDGLTLGGGVSIYQGDLDYNPGDGPVEFLSFGSPAVFVAADRAFGRIVTEATLQVDRFSIESDLIKMHLLAPSLNLTAGVNMDVIEPGSVRLYAGVAPLLAMPSYDRIDQRAIDNQGVGFEEMGTHLVWTFPVGVVIQDVVRLGVRFVAGDQLDSVASPSDERDFVTFVSVGYRFDLLR